MSDGSYVKKTRGPALYWALGAAVALVLLGALFALGTGMDADTDGVKVDFSETPCEGLRAMIDNPGGLADHVDEMRAEHDSRCQDTTVPSGPVPSAPTTTAAAVQKLTSYGTTGGGHTVYGGNGNCDRYCMMYFLGLRSGVAL